MEAQYGRHGRRGGIGPGTALAVAVAFGLITLGAACASGGAGREEGAPRRDPNLITAEELADYHNLDCHDAVRRLRPRWLQSRAGDPIVVRDGSHLGPASEYLAQIRVGQVASIRYLSATEATMRFGTGVQGGAIVVTTVGG